MTEFLTQHLLVHGIPNRDTVFIYQHQKGHQIKEFLKQENNGEKNVYSRNNYITRHNSNLYNMM